MSAAQPWRATTAAELRRHAARAVEIAAVDYLEHPDHEPALAAILRTARSHGLTVPDLVKASGLDEAFVRRLLAEEASD